MKRWTVGLALLLGIVGGPGFAADALPIAGPISAEQLREHCRQVLTALERHKASLPAPVEKELTKLLQAEVEDAAEFSVQVQRQLDACCLVGVSINPESRVKAARGPAEARLRLGQETVFLVKVNNEAGVTSAVNVAGPGLRAGRDGEAGSWLQVEVIPATAAKGLNGGKVEYVLLKLKPHEAGKREATLRFDVGQGTQDLGFRAEVPILFTVEKRDP
jgi:hypothetical protein